MHIYKTPDAELGSQALYERLTSELQAGNKVLWLLPGGSNIPISTDIMARLDSDLTKNLSLALTDERYGRIGHLDSNWQQLDDIGFDKKQATRLDVLSDDSLDLAITAETYADTLQTLWNQQNVVIGQFGMGADGHIAGVLPESPAAAATSFVAGYDAGAFERITITFAAIAQCNVVYLFAFGGDKQTALTNLANDIDRQQQPAQIVKAVPEAYIYNDQTGDIV